MQRRVWQLADGGTDAPGDDWLSDQAERVSRGARERCCRVACHPQGFRRAADDLNRLAGISLSAERLRQIAQREGRQIDTLRRSGAAEPAWRGADCRVPQAPADSKTAVAPVDSKTTVAPADSKAPVSPADSKKTVAGADSKTTVAGADSKTTVAGADSKTTCAAADSKPAVAADDSKPATSTRVYIGVDGFMAPMVTEAEKLKRRAARKSSARRDKRRRARLRRGHRERYKEFKLTAFYDQDRSHRHVLASGSGSEDAGRVLRREARRLELGQVDEVLAIVDGAPWIRAQLERFGGCDHIGLDYFHFSEHVAEAARVCFGEASPEAEAWRERVTGLALEQGVDEVLDEVTRQRSALRSSAKRSALSRLRSYVAERTSMIRYAANRAKGWDIGSGPTESLCKTMSRRLKGSGMRWDPAGAEAMLSLTALQDSDEWDRHWKIGVHEK